MTVVSYGVVVVAVVVVLSRLVDRPRLAVGMAVCAGLVLSPHLLGCDLVLLLVPFAAAWHELPQRRPLWAGSAAALAAAAAMSPTVTDLQIAAWGRALAMGPLVLAGVVAVLATAARTPTHHDVGAA